MLKKINIKALSLALLVLAVLFYLTLLRDSSGHEKTFRDEFYNFDSAQIKVILIYPQSAKHEEIRLQCVQGSQWSLKTKGVADGQVDTVMLFSAMKTLVHLKPQRLAANDKERWKEFNVTDSLGTELKLLDGYGKVLADLVIGKFSYNQQSRSGITYVRMSDDEKVYTVEGFLSPMLNQGPERWRNKVVILANKSNLNSLTFTYPDSAFVLHKEGNVWMAGNEKCDSAKVEHYLDGIVHLQGVRFMDGFDGTGEKEVYGLKLEGANMKGPVVVNAFLSKDSTDRFVVHSNLNSRAYFGGNAGNLVKAVFVSKSAFL